MNSKIFEELKKLKQKTIKKTFPPGAGPQLGRSGLRHRKSNFPYVLAAVLWNPLEFMKIY